MGKDWLAFYWNIVYANSKVTQSNWIVILFLNFITADHGKKVQTELKTIRTKNMKVRLLMDLIQGFRFYSSHTWPRYIKFRVYALVKRYPRDVWWNGKIRDFVTAGVGAVRCCAHSFVWSVLRRVSTTLLTAEFTSASGARVT